MGTGKIEQRWAERLRAVFECCPNTSNKAILGLVVVSRLYSPSLVNRCILIRRRSLLV